LAPVGVRPGIFHWFLLLPPGRGVWQPALLLTPDPGPEGDSRADGYPPIWVAGRYLSGS
jgi:hypothetical protein